MKNLIKKSLIAFSLTAALTSCDKAAEPQPDEQPLHAKQDKIKETGSQAKIATRFQWKLAKKGIFGYGQRVSLKTPIGMGYMVGGDLTFKVLGTDGALVPLTVQFLNLGKIDKNSIEPADLNKKRFNSNTIFAPDGNGADKPNELDDNSVIAVKDANDKYFLIEVTKFLGYEIEVNIYQESSLAIHARLPYELPD